MRYFSIPSLALSLIVSILLCTNLLAQDVKVTRRIMTEDEYNSFRNTAGFYEHGKNYNLKINGHGTGLRPPTEEQWKQIKEMPVVADKMEFTMTETPIAVDNSETPWFPAIGNQGAEGSCTCWATTYYTKTFQEAKEHGWDLSADTIFSPDFVYHLINGGKDNGSWYWNAIDLMADIGAASWTNMPYKSYDSTTWPSETAWREAPAYRNEHYFFIDLTTDEGIIDLKNFIGSPNLAIIGVNANKYELLSSEDLWTSDIYTTTSTNHTNTIVGYDDDFGPYIEGGITKYGAFKVANSWGIGGWENIDDGFYWISYECLKTRIEKAHCYLNIQNYNPEMIAVFEISHDMRGECNTNVGMGPASSPIAEKQFDMYIDGGRVPFADNKMVMDVTELAPYLEPGCWYNGFLSVYDGLTKTTGTINHFSVETYDDYFSGIPTDTYESCDTPLDTVKRKTVYTEAEVYID